MILKKHHITLSADFESTNGLIFLNSYSREETPIMSLVKFNAPNGLI
jgi:hypothetical protein